MRVLTALACAARCYGLQVHAVCAMSNHYHLVATDPGGKLPDFEGWLNRTLAKALNVFYGRSGVMWEPEQSYSAVELVGSETVLEKLVYVLVNPVAAGLVSCGERWPGLRAAPFEPGATLGGKRSSLYFSAKGVLPEDGRLELTKPPGFEDLDDAEFGRLLRAKVEEREAELREDAREEGRKFLGREEVLQQRPERMPGTREERGRLEPIVAASEKADRMRALGRYRAFLESYAEARVRWRCGEREVEFPYGTYWLRLHGGVRCQGPPEAA